MRILVINGPNINMLGVREPEIYGRKTYDELCRTISGHAAKRGAEVEIYQSNHEGGIVDKIQQALGNFDGIVINPAAYTHTSVALHDCIRAIKCPVVEVHMSNVHAREEFRHTSVISAVCRGVIAGFGKDSYILAAQSFKL